VEDAGAYHLAIEEGANPFQEVTPDLKWERRSETFDDGKLGIVESEW
jgi:hypothetical protein